MTTTETAAPELQAQVRDRLIESGRQAQYLSKLAEADAGTLTRAHALLILRQLGGMSSPAEGEAQVQMPRSNGGQSTGRTAYASEAQQRFATDLLRTRVLPEERVTGSVKTAAEVLAEVEKPGAQMAKAMARNIIDSYKDRRRIVQAAPAAPKAEVPAAKPAAPVDAVTEPGIYQRGDDIYKVQRSRQSQRLYAQKLVDGQFNYDAGWGAMKILRASDLMTTEQAKAFGMRFGMCVNGHPLSDRTSRYFGYGEKCAANNGWTYDKALVPADFE